MIKARLLLFFATVVVIVVVAVAAGEGCVVEATRVLWISAVTVPELLPTLRGLELGAIMRVVLGLGLSSRMMVIAVSYSGALQKPPRSEPVSLMVFWISTTSRFRRSVGVRKIVSPTTAQSHDPTRSSASLIAAATVSVAPPKISPATLRRPLRNPTQ